MISRTQPKNSDTDPIRVDFLPDDVLQLPGRLGMSFAPGKQHQGMTALWQRDLNADLTRIRQVYHTDLLVSLIEAAELQELQIPDLFPQVQAHGMASRWFPIRDFGTPTSMPGLVHLVEEILTWIDHRKTVVVHCKGGLGRSGLVVSSCLVAVGYSPQTAFEQVRRSRPGSVETPEQEQYVYQFAQSWKAA